jgi:serine/threonine-protein kinase RsbW
MTTTNLTHNRSVAVGDSNASMTQGDGSDGLGCNSGDIETVESVTISGRSRVQSLFSLKKLPAILTDVLNAMGRAGYCTRDRFAVQLALEEAVVNAVKHGHRYDPHKEVRIWWAVGAATVNLVVEDQGPGFDAALVPDPRLHHNRERPSGRGLLLIRSCMHWVHHNSRGNCLAMSRHRSQKAA